MAITSSRNSSLNPLAAGTGALIPSGNTILLIDSWADALEPRSTPVTNKCKKGKAVDQVKVEWGQNYHVPVQGTLSSGVNTSATTIPLTAGSGPFAAGGANLQINDIIAVTDYVAGSTTVLDYSTREEMRVTAIASDTSITATRGNESGTGVAHASGAVWEYVGNANPYNTAFVLAPFVRGDKLYNHPQRFATMVQADIAARNTPQYGIEGDPMLYDFKEATMRLKYGLERAIVSGQRFTGDANGASAIPHKMGGIDYFITANSGRVNNLGGRTLSPWDLEDVVRDMFKEVDDGGAKTLLMGPDTASIFDSMLDPIRMATVNDDTLKLGVKKVSFRWGDIELMHTRFMPEGRILFVDFKDISLHPYKGCAWSTKNVETDGPYDKMALWGDYTLKVDKVARMGCITNFNADLSQYARREVF